MGRLYLKYEVEKLTLGTDLGGSVLLAVEVQVGSVMYFLLAAGIHV
jgi:hypothetical protein